MKNLFCIKLLLCISAVVFVSCGEESDDSGATETTITEFSNSVLSGKRYYYIFPINDANQYSIATLVFDSDGTMTLGYGYLEDGEGTIYDTLDWEVEDGDLILDGDNVKYTVLSDNGDYIEVCGTEDIAETASCSSVDAEIFTTDKEAAKDFISDYSTLGTEISLSDITDSTLNNYFTEAEFDYIEQVEYLDLSDMAITDLDGMSQFTDVLELDLSDTHVSDISELSTMTQMDRLYLSDIYDSTTGERITLEDYDAILEMTSLTRLSMTENDDINPNTDFDLAAFLSGHVDKSTIEQLDLYDLDISEDGLDEVSGMPNLYRIAFTGSDQVTDVTALEANSWGNLERLRLGWNGDDSTVAFNLDNMISAGLVLGQLEKLELSQTTIDADDLETIAKGVGDSLDRLRLRRISTTDYSNLFAYMSAPNLEDLRLGVSSDERTTFDLENIDDNLTPSKIEILYLERADISNFAVADFTSLEYLRLRDSNISDMSIAEFEAALNSIATLEDLDLDTDFQLEGSYVDCSDLTLSSDINCED